MGIRRAKINGNLIICLQLGSEALFSFVWPNGYVTVSEDSASFFPGLLALGLDKMITLAPTSGLDEEDFKKNVRISCV